MVKPSGQAFTHLPPTTPFRQCPNGNKTYQKGLVAEFQPGWATGAFKGLRKETETGDSKKILQKRNQHLSVLITGQ